MNIDTLKILLINNSKSLKGKSLHQKYNLIVSNSYQDGQKLFEEKGCVILLIHTTSLCPDVFELLKSLNINSEEHSIPTLIILEEENQELIEKVYELGASHMCRKNMSDKVLTLSVEYWLTNTYKTYECKTTEYLLQEYKDAVDTCNIVSKTDINGFITYVNEQFCEISGYTEDELLGKPHNIIRHPEMPSSAFEEMWKTIQAKKVWRGIVKNRKKNHGIYYVDTTIKPIIDNLGNIVEYIGIRKDITEQENFKKELQHELSLTTNNLHEMMQRSREYHKAMDESTILTRADLNGKITYVNNEFTNVLGYTLEEMIGKDHKILKHPDTHKVIIKNLWDTILSGNTWRGVIQNIDKYGETIWLDTVIVPIKNMTNEIVEYLTIRHNVSEIVMLNQEIEQTQGELIYTLGSAAETRSKETSNHIKRVAHYSKLLASLIGLDDDEAEILYQASPMHDIGKLAIPDNILKKPGPLNDHEWDIMRTHSELGHKILASSNRPILKASSIVAHEHHEKWDGTGYPRGLKGNDIHIYGRITAIADVFDALGSDRVYKKAWELESILELFKNERGKHFDPHLIDLFLKNVDAFVDIGNKYRDLPISESE